MPSAKKLLTTLFLCIMTLSTTGSLAAQVDENRVPTQDEKKRFEIKLDPKNIELLKSGGSLRSAIPDNALWKNQCDRDRFQRKQ